MQPSVRNIQVLVLILCLVLAGSVLAKKKADEQSRVPIRADHLPTMGFLRGTLQQGINGNWEIDETVLYLTAGAQWSMEGRSDRAAQPRAGRDAILMGFQVGNVFHVTRGQILLRDYEVPERESDFDVEWSTVDPSVGEGKGSNPM